MKVCDVQGGDRLHYFTLVPIEKRKNRENLGDGTSGTLLTVLTKSPLLKKALAAVRN